MFNERLHAGQTAGRGRIRGHLFSTHTPKGEGVGGQAPCVCQCIVAIVTSYFVRTGWVDGSETWKFVLSYYM